jgi:hypothetical protein
MSDQEEHNPTSAEVLHWMDPDVNGARGKTADDVAAMQVYAGVGSLYDDQALCPFPAYTGAAIERGWIGGENNGFLLYTDAGRRAIRTNRRRIAAEGEDR